MSFFIRLCLILWSLFTHSQPRVDQRPVEEMRLAVILVKLAGSDERQLLQKDELENFFEGILPEYFNFISRGKLRYSHRIFGWYTVNIEECDGFDSIHRAIQVADEDINFSEYTHVHAIFHHAPLCPEFKIYGRADTQLSSIRTNDGQVKLFTSSIRLSDTFREVNNFIPFKPRAWMGLVLHELIHNFGIGHHNALECKQNFSGLHLGCFEVDYGNPLSLMGAGWVTGTFGTERSLYRSPSFGWLLNSTMLYRAGFLNDFEYRVITAPGTFRVRPVNSNTPLSLHIFNPQTSHRTRTYIVDSFRSSKWANLSAISAQRGAVFISYRSSGDYYDRFEPETNTIDLNSVNLQLLDMSPETFSTHLGDFVSSALPVRKTFTDEEAGIKITNLSFDYTTNTNLIGVEFLQPQDCPASMIDPILTTYYWTKTGLGYGTARGWCKKNSECEFSLPFMLFYTLPNNCDPPNRYQIEISGPSDFEFGVRCEGSECPSERSGIGSYNYTVASFRMFLPFFYAKAPREFQGETTVVAKLRRLDTNEVVEIVPIKVLVTRLEDRGDGDGENGE
ncbi:MAG: hypothetical protein NZT61_03050 [Deltaproteobacteria bacterium]|nr:hypothetical protein [Deltaproteobacteria bacterium]